ncbi:Hsp70-Hsp90 organizing protein 2 [Linum grandiflorum]
MSRAAQFLYGSSHPSPPPLHPQPIPSSSSAGSRTRTCVRAETNEIRVCTNRTCRKQGSFQTLDLLTGIAPPTIVVNRCGCLGNCGAGPNVVILPQGVIRYHCGTASRAALLMSEAVGVDSATVASSLEALALRKRAELEIEKGDFSAAELLLSRAIDMKPFGGLHIMHKFRSSARLAMGDYSGALEDAREALEQAPKYAEAYLCEGDAFMAMEQYDAAEKSYSICLQIDPSIRRSKPFKNRVANLQEKLSVANASSTLE